MSRKNHRFKGRPLDCGFVGKYSGRDEKPVTEIMTGDEVMAEARQGLNAFRYLRNQLVEKKGATKATLKTVLGPMEFHLIDFNVRCRDNVDGRCIPVEVGMVAYNLVDGVVDEYHELMNPGDAPVGRASEVNDMVKVHGVPMNVAGREFSPEVERICGRIIERLQPTKFSLARTVEPSKVKDPKELVNAGFLAKDALLVCFTRDETIAEIYGCIEWLKSKDTSVDWPTVVVLGAGDLLGEMVVMNNIRDEKDDDITYGTALARVTESRHECSIRLNCTFHREIDNNNCALASVKRMAAVFDQMLGKHLRQ